ncbi:hypothetical protein L596_016653 [Steinernema carpocapsae]|uniref:Uncharacterized protein n=1 Tax=Steinernema carpocapsae TaxID=34508 RepID=A0A4U5NIM3_STECR|nr:hypothetical protein L596_016653 [Steinernema carpocapsae]
MLCKDAHSPLSSHFLLFQNGDLDRKRGPQENEVLLRNQPTNGSGFFLGSFSTALLIGKQVLQRRHSASRARNRRWEVPHSTGHEGRSCVLQGDRRHAADGNLQDQGNVQTAGPRNPRRGDGEGHAGERAGALQRFSGGFEKFRRSEEID